MVEGGAVPVQPQVEAGGVLILDQADRDAGEVPEVELRVLVAHREHQAAHRVEPQPRRLQADGVVRGGEVPDVGFGEGRGGGAQQAHGGGGERAAEGPGIQESHAGFPLGGERTVTGRGASHSSTPPPG